MLAKEAHDLVRRDAKELLPRVYAVGRKPHTGRDYQDYRLCVAPRVELLRSRKKSARLAPRALRPFEARRAAGSKVYVRRLKRNVARGLSYKRALQSAREGVAAR